MVVVVLGCDIVFGDRCKFYAILPPAIIRQIVSSTTAIVSRCRRSCRVMAKRTDVGNLLGCCFRS